MTKIESITKKMEHGDFLNLKSPEVAEMLGYEGKKNSDGRLESITVDKDTGMPLTLKEDGTFENPDKAKVVSVDSPEFTMLMRARLQKEDYKDFKGEPKEESYDGKGLGYTDKDKAALFNSMKDAASGSVNLTYGEAISISRVGKRKDNKEINIQLGKGDNIDNSSLKGNESEFNLNQLSFSSIS